MFEIFQIGLCQKYFPGNVPNVIISIIAVIFAGYLLGSLNFGIIISKLFYKDDIRKYGSKNAGMTNMKRICGTKAAIFTLLGDALKTALAVFIGALLLGDHVQGYTIPGTYLGGFASILGHIFPVYYKFKGGKGVVAAATMILCTDWIVFIVLFIMFVCIVAWTKYISLGSIMCIMIYPVLLNRMTGIGFHIVISMLTMLIIVILHRSNIKRLLKGEESKFSLKKKGEKEKKKS